MSYKPASELKAIYAELSKSSGVPEEQVARVLGELGLNDVKSSSSLKNLSVRTLKAAVRAAAAAVAE